MADMPVAVVPYDPQWAAHFAAERARLETLLAPWLDGAVEHVGSTSVPGLAAKPVVDVLAPVADLEEAREAFPLLREASYVHWAEDPMPWRHWFLKPRVEARTHHLYLVERRHPEFRAIVGFRDHLRAHPDEAAAYARLKLDLAHVHRDDREAYTAGKTAYVRGVLSRLGLLEGTSPRDG